MAWEASWVLNVIDPSRQFIPNAEVVLDGSVLAVSGSDGKAHVGRSFQDASGGLTLDVHAEGYLTESVRLRSDSTEEEVVLTPSMDLFGQVVCNDGTPVAGVLLVALEAGRPWSRGLVSDLTDGSTHDSPASHGFTCESEVDGSFRFHDLPSGVRYEVLALGDGLASPMGPKLSPTNGVAMEVVVARLRGVAVDFVMDREGGGEIQDPAIDFRPYFQQYGFRGPRLDPYIALRAAEGFHGIPACYEGGPDLVLVFSGSCELHEESWLELPIGFPGYASTTVLLPLSEVRRDGWNLHEVALHPTAERWGQVFVRFFGVPPAALARLPEGDRVVGGLRLKDPEGRHLVRPVVARELAGGIEVELPAGDYELDFQASDSYFVASESPAHVLALAVADGASATAAIDLSACGFTELHVTDPSGAPYAGRLIVEVVTKDTLIHTAWVEPPYLLSLVPAGKYEVRPYLPGLVGKDLYAFDVRRGELTHLSLEGIVGEEPSFPGR